MKVSHRIDLTSHTGPEPKGGCSNTMADVWVDNGGKRRRGIREMGSVHAKDWYQYKPRRRGCAKLMSRGV